MSDKGEEICYEPKVLGERLVGADEFNRDSDPWKGRNQEAIAHGRQVYHINAQCRTCHPSYVTQEELFGMTEKVGWGYAEMKYRSQLKKSAEIKGETILPIDFLYHPIKSLRADDSAVETRRRLFRVIGSGIQGAAMPVWKGALSDEDLWSLAYYIQDIAALRDTPQGTALRRKIDDPSQKAWTPPQRAAATP